MTYHLASNPPRVQTVSRFRGIGTAYTCPSGQKWVDGKGCVTIGGWGPSADLQAQANAAAAAQAAAVLLLLNRWAPTPGAGPGSLLQNCLPRCRTVIFDFCEKKKSIQFDDTSS